jgi:hypothetical protein
MSSGERQADLDELVTEGRRAAPSEYDLLSTVELVELMNREDAAVPAAVLAAGEKLAAAVDAIVERGRMKVSEEDRLRLGRVFPALRELADRIRDLDVGGQEPALVFRA